MPKVLNGALETRWETERTTQAETRYGCFLPDLTGLARSLSAADLPPHYIRWRPARGKCRLKRRSAAPRHDRDGRNRVAGRKAAMSAQAWPSPAKTLRSRVR